MKRSFLLGLLLLAVVALPAAASAREIYLLGGVDRLASGCGSDSYSWQLGYTQELSPHIASSFGYVNEGHFPGHRRDGYSAQLWARTDLLEDKVNLGAGAGPYLYFDTEDRGAGQFQNRHGWRAQLSVAATIHAYGNLLLILRSNYITANRGPDTISALAGIGYEFENEARNKSVPLQRPNNEITLYVGQTIANSLSSQQSVATELEYRRTLLRHVDWTLAFLNEGDTRLYRRDGVVTQFWATQELYRNRVAIAAGAGAYFDVKHYQSSGSRVLGIIAMSGSYRLTPHWALRVTWSRVVTDNDRDTDVLLGGVGYRF